MKNRQVRNQAHPAGEESLATSMMESPVGRLVLRASKRGLRSVAWGRVPRCTGSERAPAEATAILERAERQLREYFEGRRREFDLPLDPVGTEFQKTAWKALSRIGYGETLTYAEQARRMGHEGKPRATGAANGRNPIAIIVPCHRVIGSNGKLTGFTAGLKAKAFLLELEKRPRSTLQS